MAEILVSIIIPTYNGAHKIPGVLRSLTRQTFNNFEVIIVIDGSSDSTENAVQAMLPELNYPLLYRYIKNSGRSVARNTGATLASGPILVFLDDDMLPEPGCLEEHLKLVTITSNVVSVGAQLTYIPNKRVNDFYYYKKKRSLQGDQILKNTEQPLPENKLFLTAANFCISNKDFQRVGMFNEKTLFQEDYELARACYRNKVAIRYNPQAIAWHNEKIDLEYLVKQEKTYRGWRVRVGQVTDLKKSFLQRVLSNLFRFMFSIKLLDRNNYLKLLPKFIRFKLYDFIIFSHASKDD